MPSFKVFITPDVEQAADLVVALQEAGFDAGPLDRSKLQTADGGPLLAGDQGAVRCFLPPPETNDELNEAVAEAAPDAIELGPFSAEELDRPLGKLRLLHEAASRSEADLVVSLLQSEGINATAIGGTFGGLWASGTNTFNPARVYVADFDFGRAEKVRAQMAAQEASPARLQRRAPREETPWPACPDCQKPRLAVCPYCSSTSADLKRADPNFDDEPDEGEERSSGMKSSRRIAVLCNICDEPFRPGFLRRCEWCGHDFGSGVEAQVPGAPRRAHEEDAGLNPRALLVIVAMLAIGGGILWYFSTILR